jgi:polyketide cyclase/dehydrase/lipid transport protein
MKKKIAFAAVSLALAIAAAMIFFSPKAGNTERVATVRARPALVLAQLSDLQRWTQWMPRDRRDPRAQRSFGGPRTGVGSSYYWSSNDDELGKGRMTVITANEQRVQIERELTKPTNSTLDIVFTLAAEGSVTRVAVTVTGQADLAGNPLRRFSNAESNLASELDEALQHLAAAAEGQALVESSRVERSRIFSATPSVVREQLAEIRRWASWAPWPDNDAKLRRDYGGHASGPGATCYWSGQGRRGQVTIISAGLEKVIAEVEVFQPQPSSTDLAFVLAPEGAGTKVTLSAVGTTSGPALEAALTRLSAAIASGKPQLAAEPR